jgi:hypothetical protein
MGVVADLPSIRENESVDAGLCTASVSRLILAAAARANSGSAGGAEGSVTMVSPVEEELARFFDDFPGDEKDVLRPFEPLRSFVKTLCSWFDDSGEGWLFPPLLVPGLDFAPPPKNEEEKKLATFCDPPDFCISSFADSVRFSFGVYLRLPPCSLKMFRGTALAISD